MNESDPGKDLFCRSLHAANSVRLLLQNNMTTNLLVILTAEQGWQFYYFSSNLPFIFHQIHKVPQHCFILRNSTQRKVEINVFYRIFLRSRRIYIFSWMYVILILSYIHIMRIWWQCITCRLAYFSSLSESGFKGH
jgi:hypothetical protein